MIAALDAPSRRTFLARHDGRDVDDRAYALLQRRRQNAPCDPEHGLCIQIKGAIPVRVGTVKDGVIVDPACAIHQNLQRRRRANQSAHGVGIKHIKLVCSDFANSCCETVDSFAINVRCDNGAAALRQGLSRSTLNPVACGGEEGSLPMSGFTYVLSQRASQPPSTVTTLPWQCAAASEARNTAAPAILDGSAKRPAGIRSSKALERTGSSRSACVLSVAV